MKKKLLFNNTYNSGSINLLILEEKKDKYIGVCLEFDLEIEAKTLEKAKEQIVDYTHLWLRNAIKHKLPEEVLNRPAPKKYWKIYKDLVEQDLKKLEAEKKTSVYMDIEPLRVVRYQSPYPNFAFA